MGSKEKQLSSKVNRVNGADQNLRQRNLRGPLKRATPTKRNPIFQNPRWKAIRNGIPSHQINFIETPRGQRQIAGMPRRRPRLALRASRGQKLAEMRSIETTKTAFLIMAFFNVFFITDEAQNKVVLFKGPCS